MSCQIILAIENEIKLCQNSNNNICTNLKYKEKGAVIMIRKGRRGNGERNYLLE